ncbi:MAG: photosynthetic complex putative assembly protein PuhB [Hyphomicrobium sp.]
MSDREYEVEPVPGLPEMLPEGEHFIWQGSPDANGVAWRVMHVNAVAIYFLLLATAPLAMTLAGGGTIADAFGPTARVIVAGVLALALLALIARLIARTTIYTITNKRVVMRYGVALPMTLNIPFNEISGVDRKDYADGTSDIALSTSGPLRLSYLHLWPHARGWHLEKAQPTLRSVPKGDEVAASLVSAMISAGVPGTMSSPRHTASDAARPSLDHHGAPATA